MMEEDHEYVENGFVNISTPEEGSYKVETNLSQPQVLAKLAAVIDGMGKEKEFLYMFMEGMLDKDPVRLLKMLKTCSAFLENHPEVVQAVMEMHQEKQLRENMN